jgi:hypothetical protein
MGVAKQKMGVAFKIFAHASSETLPQILHPPLLKNTGPEYTKTLLLLFNP